MDEQGRPLIRATATMQDYLKAVLRLEKSQTPVPTSALAEALDVTPSAVTAMSCKLHVGGMVRYAAYHGMELTEAGRREALRVVRAHRLVEVMMVRWMGYGWEDVEEDADRLEHVLSPDFVDRLEARLDFPCCCPHGDPIPAPDGTLRHIDERPLAALAVGESDQIFRVSGRDRALLKHFREEKLVPGAQIKLLDIAPFGGPLTCDVEGEERVISPLVAQNVFVYA